MTLLTRTRPELHEALDHARRGGTLALVPTMGALHRGHRALLRHARAHADTVAVSIFVNPLQFGPGEDLDRYPRTLDADLDACAAEGVDVVWAPGPQVVYPQPPMVTVHAGQGGEVYEGAIRPGHFDGVLTVVCKLVSAFRPDVVVFGQKDAQQLVLVRRMVADLDLGARIEAVPTVREPDGLALSSRNRYLDTLQRHSAVALSRALRAGQQNQADGATQVLRAASAVLRAEPGMDIDYLALVNPATLRAVADDATGEALLLVAARFGPTRLIDNTPLQLGVPA